MPAWVREMPAFLRDWIVNYVEGVNDSAWVRMWTGRLSMGLRMSPEWMETESKRY